VLVNGNFEAGRRREEVVVVVVAGVAVLVRGGIRLGEETESFVAAVADGVVVASLLGIFNASFEGTLEGAGGTIEPSVPVRLIFEATGAKAAGGGGSCTRERKKNIGWFLLYRRREEEELQQLAMVVHSKPSEKVWILVCDFQPQVVWGDLPVWMDSKKKLFQYKRNTEKKKKTKRGERRKSFLPMENDFVRIGLGEEGGETCIRLKLTAEGKKKKKKKERFSCLNRKGKKKKSERNEEKAKENTFLIDGINVESLSVININQIVH
jgi:hypothetical protein